MTKKLFTSILAMGFVFSAPIVAGAYTIDLTQGTKLTADSDTWNGAIFTTITNDTQIPTSSGTGVIDPFLTIRKTPTEEGFNSDYLPLVQDTQRPKWNHSIQVSDLFEYTPGMTGYYEFLLDINEPAAHPKNLITQHELQVYVADNSVGGSIATFADLQTNATLIWDLDGPEESEVIYDYNIWEGSGGGMDAGFYLPTSLFSSYDANDYVYLYAKFGNSGYKSEAGFEEYILRVGGAPVPEPATMLIFGTGLATLAGLRRRRKK